MISFCGFILVRGLVIVSAFEIVIKIKTDCRLHKDRHQNETHVGSIEDVYMTDLFLGLKSAH